MSHAKANHPASQVLEQIAKQHLLVDSLVEQGSDSLDFKDLHVAGIRAALEAAYLAGQQSRASKPIPAGAKAGTALAAYHAAAGRIQALLGRLQADLDAHAKTAAAKPENWGYAGDLGRVEAALVDIAQLASQ